MPPLEEYHDEPAELDLEPDASSGSNPASNDYMNRFRTDDDTMYSVRNPGAPPGFGSTPAYSEPARDKNAKLYRLIGRAVSPMYHEPNLSLNLEVADYINRKQGTWVHDAAIRMVEKINNSGASSSQTAVLAIGLLDICVKNCGYPFHLQISRKEFLNQLVHGFPYHAPFEYTKVQYLILELIEEWVQTICKTAPYKNDLVAIVQIHNFLASKGYVFPEINQTEAAVLNQPEDNLKSIQELRKEETALHQAKLQELIRSGKPDDLREANKLMKILAGFQDTKNDKNNYREKYEQVIEQIKNKAELLYEMLQVVTTPEELVDNEIIDELLASVKSTKPKLEKIIAEYQNSEDSEDQTEYAAYQDLMNSINLIIQRHDLIKQGDMTSANLISDSLIDFGDSSVPTPTSVKQEPVSSTRLEDIFGGIPTKSSEVSQPKKTNNLEDLLGVLDLNESVVIPESNPMTTAATTATTSKPPSEGSSKIILNTPDQLKLTLFYSQATPSQLILTFRFDNNSILSTFTGVDFQLSLPRGRKVHLDPISSTTIEAFSSSPVTQRALVDIDGNADQHQKIKFKWKVGYDVDGKHVEDSGLVDDLFI